MRRPTPTERWARRALAAFACAALLGCAVHDPSPPAFKRTLKTAQSTPYGAWIVVALSGGELVTGELLAVDDGTLYVARDTELHVLPLRTVARARISLYEARTGRVVVHTTLGTLSTLSHGFVLVLSAPIWIVSGALIARGQSRTSHVHYTPRTGWRTADRPTWGIARYARFPQGLPPGYGRPPPPPPPAGPTVGTEGGLCYGNGTCEAPLRCVDDVCSPPPEVPDEVTPDAGVRDAPAPDGGVPDAPAPKESETQ
jgi:hypothetical protein